MGTLTELGLISEKLMLVSPPDDVLAEAGRMNPRPATASTIQTAEPTPWIAWWLEQRFLDPAPLSRLKWILESGNGQAWLIFDPVEEGLTSDLVRARLGAVGLTSPSEQRLASGEIAIRTRTS
jgi:hypothetical protein